MDGLTRGEEYEVSQIVQRENILPDEAIQRVRSKQPVVEDWRERKARDDAERDRINAEIRNRDDRPTYGLNAANLAELRGLEKMMKNTKADSEYWFGPEAKVLQARYYHLLTLSDAEPGGSGADGMGQAINSKVDNPRYDNLSPVRRNAMDNIAKLREEAENIAIDLNIDRRAGARILHHLEDIGASSNDPEGLDDSFRALGPTAVNYAINMLNGRLSELAPRMQREEPVAFAALENWLVSLRKNEPAVYQMICDIAGYDNG